MKKLFLIILCLFYTASSQAEGLAVIRDSEIEEVIREMTNPIFRQAGLDPKNVKIYLINSDQINAFVSGGMNVFVNTALLSRSDGPLMFMGVVAHETGHIKNGHLIRKSMQVEKASLKSILSYVLGAAAIAGGAGGAGQAIIASGTQYAKREAMQYSRIQEESADKTGMQILEGLKLSSGGLLEILQYLSSQENLFFDKANPYILSHPLSSQRMEYVRKFVASSPNSGNHPSAAIQEKYKRAVAKLKGFTQTPDQTYSDYPESDKSFAARYARAIADYKVPDINKSLKEIDELIKEEPKNAYLYELRGQILFETGQIAESITYYQKALNLMPNEPLLQLGLASSQIAESDRKSDPKMLDNAIGNLKRATTTEPKNSLAWRLLATAYGKKGDEGHANLYLMEEASSLERNKEAKRFAEIAKELLSNDKQALIRINDVLKRLDNSEKD